MFALKQRFKRKISAGVCICIYLLDSFNPSLPLLPLIISHCAESDFTTFNQEKLAEIFFTGMSCQDKQP